MSGFQYQVLLGEANFDGDATINTLAVTGKAVINELMLPNGAADGWVLTSDVNGIASWKPDPVDTLAGDVSGLENANTVDFVGGSSSVDVHNATLLANAATDQNTAETIVKRDADGNFSAGIITADLDGNAATADNATHADSADNATHADSADNATHANTADSSTSADTAASASALKNGSTWLIPMSGASPSSNQVLTYDGSNAVWQTPTVGVSTATPDTTAKRDGNAGCAFAEVACSSVNNSGSYKKDGTVVLQFILDKYNIFCGDTVGGASSSTGMYNVLVGSHVGEPMTSGGNNTGVGHSALWHLTSGNQNTAVGLSALSDITTAENCTAIGAQAGIGNLTGSGCTYLGAGASAGVDTSYTNSTAVGYGAFITKSHQLVLGDDGLEEVFTKGVVACSYVDVVNSYQIKGTEVLRIWNDFTNIFVGEGTWSWKTITGGGSNTSLGVRNATYFTSGSNNTLIGAWTGEQLTSGDGLTAIGMAALQLCTNAGYNTACGNSALHDLTTGAYCTSIGRNSGQSHTTGDHCTYLGESARTDDGTLSNSTAVGANAIITTNNQIVLGDSNVSSVQTTGHISCGGITLNANKHFRAIGNQLSYQYGTGCRDPPDHDIPGQPYPVEGNDTCGRIIVTTYNPQANAFIVRVTFNTPYSSPPIIVFSAANKFAAVHIDHVYMDSYNTGFDFMVRDSTNLTGDTQYIWNYHVMEIV